MANTSESSSVDTIYPVAQPVIYEISHELKLEMASKIKVHVNEPQDNVLAACFNGAIPRALRQQVSWLLAYVLPRPTNEGDKPLDWTKIQISNIDLILWVLLNYNQLIHGKERILLRTEKEKTGTRIAYGIIVPAACKPDSISIFQKTKLLNFGWMSKVPQTAKEEPKTTLLVPADGHGAKFYQFGYTDELQQLLECKDLPETAYRGPTLDWAALTPDLKKGLHELQTKQGAFEDVWKDATKKHGPMTITGERRRHSELSPFRMEDAVFGWLLDQKPQLKEPEEEVVPEVARRVRFNVRSEDDVDFNDHEPYSLALMAGALYIKPEVGT